jgi:hypothetical protein
LPGRQPVGHVTTFKPVTPLVMFRLFGLDGLLGLAGFNGLVGLLGLLGLLGFIGLPGLLGLFGLAGLFGLFNPGPVLRVWLLPPDAAAPDEWTAPPLPAPAVCANPDIDRLHRLAKRMIFVFMMFCWWVSFSWCGTRP